MGRLIEFEANDALAVPAFAERLRHRASNNCNLDKDLAACVRKIRVAQFDRRKEHYSRRGWRDCKFRVRPSVLTGKHSAEAATRRKRFARSTGIARQAMPELEDRPR
jgi:hypothetical protein